MSSTKADVKSETIPTPLRIHPQVFVTDLERALAFYRDGLGFSVAYTYGSPPFYALVERGAVGLNLRHVDEPFDPARRAREDLLSAMVVTTELKALFLSFKDAGVEFHQTLMEQPWGHDFIVRDPDGNLLGFSAPANAAV